MSAADGVSWETLLSQGAPGSWWHRLEDGRVQCDLCPRDCQLHEGQRGACYVRQAVGGEIRLMTYGRSSGFCIDPMEKKPLNHFYPGSSIFSFGTAGCNLVCKFCQNSGISHSRNVDSLVEQASPEQIVEVARRFSVDAVAYTYNDPVIFAEYAMDTARLCREAGVFNVAVTAGYIHAQARREFFSLMDAANIDLKAFTERFYRGLCGAHLQPVLDTLAYVYHETNCWVEVTTLLIPGENDSAAEIRALAAWIRREMGPDVPLHLSAFSPAWRMQDVPKTSLETLRVARQMAREEGLDYVFTGNVHDNEGGTTYCPSCQAPLIVRDWYNILRYEVNAEGCCQHCGTRISGRFRAQLGRDGTAFGPKRIPVHMGAPQG